ncbi:MAG TPA: metal-dependent hydrolase, partial [Rudaea sp.]
MNAHLETSKTLPVRRFVADYAEDTPRHWCPDNPVVTHLLNTYTLLVPGNEGFFIRALKEATPQLPADLQETVTQFSYQEGQHGVGHLRFWR